MDISNLRKTKIGKQPMWTLEELGIGLEHYKELYGKYPSAEEIDKFEFLPSSKSIQRSHGGLVAVRTKLGFEDSLIDHTKGPVRSEKAKTMYKNGTDYEFTFYKFLVNLIPEVRVHEHKILRPGGVCCDFFIYTSQSSGFAIDIFYAQDISSLQKQVRIKTLRYKNVSYETYYVLVGNESITQEEINSMLNNRKSFLPQHITVLTEVKFKMILNQKIEALFIFK
jgi:hypothetical protein